MYKIITILAKYELFKERELPHVRDNWEEGDAEREQEDGEGSCEVQ